MSYKDKNLTCTDCNRSFVYGAEDQELSGELGYAQPRCCRACWRAREEGRRDEGGSSAA